jgi:hypothetical protein
VAAEIVARGPDRSIRPGQADVTVRGCVDPRKRDYP